jgi:serine protease AprX
VAEGRITVHFGRDHQGLIAEVLRDAVMAGGLACGVTDELGVERLREAGLVVEPVPPPGPPQTGRPPTPPRMAGFVTLALAVRQPALEEPVEPQEIDTYLIALDGPLFEQWRTRLRDAGAELLERRATRTWSAVMRSESVPGVRDLDFVADLRLYTALDTVHPAELAAAPEWVMRFEVIVHPGVEPPVVADQIADLHLEVEAVTIRSVRFQARPSDPALVQIARLPMVASLAEYREPTAANDRARALAGIEPPPRSGAATLQWTGVNQIVGVADSGVDDAHTDLQGRLRNRIARGRPGDHSDPTGHGTHVAATIAGTGQASNGAYRGMAPDAELVFQSIMDANQGWSGIKSMTDLLDEAYNAGVRIHNDSWAVEANASAYPAYSLELDDFVHGHPDLLVIVAAGNSGSAAQPVNSPPGWVDLLSMGAPGTAKNALTVGACRSDRVPVGAPPQTFGARFKTAFPTPPVRDYDVSGDAQWLAAFSSRGPCDDQLRVKPDLVAPGTYILSARATNVAGPFWEPGPSAEYVYDGGTSMAAPVVAGCAALVREYLADDRSYDDPSAALMKAIIINGAQTLTGADATARPSGEPNFHQGFGALSLRTSVPNDAEPNLELAFHDDWSGACDIQETGGGLRFDVSADPKLPLRVCLAWIDPPGRSVQNCLALRVRHNDSAGEWVGNQQRPQYLAAGLDQANNVQVVRIDPPLAGGYELWVEATSITVPGQSFALVVTGALTSGLALAQSY